MAVPLDLTAVTVSPVVSAGLEIKDRDVLGITESIVARCEGNYVTIDEVRKSNNNIHYNKYL